MVVVVQLRIGKQHVVCDFLTGEGIEDEVLSTAHARLLSRRIDYFGPPGCAFVDIN